MSFYCITSLLCWSSLRNNMGGRAAHTYIMHPLGKMKMSINQSLVEHSKQTYVQTHVRTQYGINRSLMAGAATWGCIYVRIASTVDCVDTCVHTLFGPEVRTAHSQCRITAETVQDSHLWAIETDLYKDIVPFETKQAGCCRGAVTLHNGHYRQASLVSPASPHPIVLLLLCKNRKGEGVGTGVRG